MRVTLTFDNGPKPGATEAILDVLAAYGIRATFFVIGKCLENSEARRAAERAHDEGHWIGNHTFSHEIPLGLDMRPDHVDREVASVERLLGKLGHPDRYFRPHGKGKLGPHVLSAEACEYLIQNKCTLVTWNNVPGDWIEPRLEWSRRALQNMQGLAWSVLVLHDPHLADIMSTLPAFLDDALSAGFEFVQEFPLECLPILRGEVLRPLMDLVHDSNSVAGTA